MTKNNIKSGQLVKEQHLNTLLRHLILDDCTTRIGLAKKTGLTKMTVTNLVNELIQNKLICETGTQESKDSLPGRRPIYLVVHPEAPHIIDVTIGRDFLSVSRVDMKSNSAAKICNRFCIRSNRNWNTSYATSPTTFSESAW